MTRQNPKSCGHIISDICRSCRLLRGRIHDCLPDISHFSAEPTHPPLLYEPAVKKEQLLDDYNLARKLRRHQLLILHSIQNIPQLLMGKGWSTALVIAYGSNRYCDSHNMRLELLPWRVIPFTRRGIKKQDLLIFFATSQRCIFSTLHASNAL